MILYFENSKGEIRRIGKIDGRLSDDKINDEVFKQIRMFCDDHGYNIPYVRVWCDSVNGKTASKFDVGSHSECFYTVPQTPFPVKDRRK